MKKVSAKQRMLNFLKKTEGANSFTVKQGRRQFGVKNVAARIEELRKDGFKILTETRKTGVSAYRLQSNKPLRQSIVA